MFRDNEPRRRLSDRSTAAPSSIGAGMMVTGSLSCEGDLVVAGSVKGESQVCGTFTLLERGRWEGNIEASNAVIAGAIQGSIAVAEMLEIRKSANISGSVQAQTIAVAEGAVIDGPMTVKGDTPVRRFQERRRST
jgi:cytoskeletal protein CcmA (bactofilin family)